MGFGMLSFQPAAYVGNPKRWRDDFHAVDIDTVWREIERGIGTPVPGQHVQMGDPRCNRSCHGVMAGEHWTPVLDHGDPRDLRTRDVFLDGFGGMDFERDPWIAAIAIARVIVRHPQVVTNTLGWAARFVRRAGALHLRRGRPRVLTFVVHAFMDADVVRPAWEAMERGETATKPDVRGAQERLHACSYGEAHPDQDRLVPACVQHSVLDPHETAQLLRLLPPLPERSPRGSVPSPTPPG